MAENDDQDNAQKTEEPTAKKLREARQRGQVPLSREINNWIMLMVATVLIMTVSGSMFSELSGFMRLFIERSHDIPMGKGGVAAALSHSVLEVAKIMALPLLILMIAAFMGPFIQIGPIFSTETIMPKLEKISPMKGFKRLFSKKSLMEFLKGLLKITIIGVVGVVILKPYFGQLDHMVGLPMMLILDELQSLAVKLMIGVLIVLIVVAVIDLVFQRYEFNQNMRMTKQEVKDEFKQTEGDPHIRARLRSLRAERARQRMMQNVPKADVVITNPTHFSIALQYNPEEMDAPVCVAKGIDEVALRIREVAKDHGIILYENIPLARSLYEVVEVDQMIPEDQYKAVAEVISFVFKKKGRSKG